MTYLSLHSRPWVLLFFGSGLLFLVAFALSLPRPATHSQVAQADLCILCTHGGSTREDGGKSGHGMEEGRAGREATQVSSLRPPRAVGKGSKCGAFDCAVPHLPPTGAD